MKNLSDICVLILLGNGRVLFHLIFRCCFHQVTSITLTWSIETAQCSSPSYTRPWFVEPCPTGMSVPWGSWRPLRPSDALLPATFSQQRQNLYIERIQIFQWCPCIQYIHPSPLDWPKLGFVHACVLLQSECGWGIPFYLKKQQRKIIVHSCFCTTAS